MNDRALRDALRALCAKYDCAMPESWVVFLALAHQWGERMNLTAARDAATLCELLFLDAIHLLNGEFVDRSGAWVDIGAGVGAPTIPILLCSPELRATLVEPRRKRVAFLRTATGKLNLANRVFVIEERLDVTAPSVGDNEFSLALSRATFAPEAWLEIGLQLADNVLVFGTVDSAFNVESVEKVSYCVPSTGAPRTLYTFGRTA